MFHKFYGFGFPFLFFAFRRQQWRQKKRENKLKMYILHNNGIEKKTRRIKRLFNGRKLDSIKKLARETKMEGIKGIEWK